MTYEELMNKRRRVRARIAALDAPPKPVKKNNTKKSKKPENREYMVVENIEEVNN